MKDHVEHLKVTFRLLMQYHLYARRSKCQFVVASVKYLRYYISTEGVFTDPKKIIVVQQ